jgi:Tol biopolymer transport system component
MIRRLALLFAPLAALGCGGAAPPDAAPSALEARAAGPLTLPSPPAGAGGEGNVVAASGAQVVFLPPLGEGHADAPTADVEPVVRIEALPPAEPSVVAEISLRAGSGGDPLRITGNHFLALWDTSGAEPGVVYRVRVLVEGDEAGFADVAVVAPGERAGSGTHAVVAGQTLPVKFAIHCGEGGCGRPWLERVSVDSAGVEGNGASGVPAISADGRLVAFSSVATNLAAGDANGARDVFLHDRATRATTRVSVLSGGAEIQGWSGMPSMSADGNEIAFVAASAQVCGCGGYAPYSVLVHDRRSGETVLASARPDGTPNREDAAHPALSADGRFVAFSSADDHLVPGGNWWEDVFIRDLVTGETVVGSLRPDGMEPTGASGEPSLSGDGGLLAFASSARDLVPGDGNWSIDVFVRDLSTGAVVRASVGPQGAEADRESRSPRISADGRLVVFQSLASNLVPGDDNGAWDVFVHDLGSGATTLVSARGDGSPGSGASIRPSISSDGRLVAFESSAPDLVAGDGNGRADAFVRELATGVTVRASADALGADAPGDGGSPALAGCGDAVAFTSDAPTLVPSDTNGVRDVFVRRLR